MLRVIALFVFLGFLSSCSSQPAKDESGQTQSCNGDCSKNLNKLATPEAPASTDKTPHKKKSKKNK